MQLRKAVALLALLVVAGCEQRHCVIVLDSWWNVDFAKDVCRTAGLNVSEVCDPFGDKETCKTVKRRQESCAFSAEGAGGIQDYQSKLKSVFGYTPECNGIELVEYGGPSSVDQRTIEKAMLGKHWALTIDFDPGAPSQSWGLVGPDSQYVSGEGSIDVLAKRSCAIVSGRGAQLAN